MRIIIIFTMGILLILGCGRGGSGLEFSGTLEMTEHQLGAKAAGRLVTLTVDDGSVVKAEQIIATLDRFEQNKKDFERAEALFKQGGADAQTVEYARLNMEDQAVVSPIDGVVLVKVHELGEIVTAGSAVAVIGDPKDQWVRVFVPQGQINRVQQGQKAWISFDGLKQVYAGHVRYIATKAEFTPRNVQTAEERVTQAFAVKVAVDAPDLQAHPGVAANVRL